MATPMVTVVQVYNQIKPYSMEADAAFDALSYILDMIYTETLREEEGGTYGASTSPQVSNKPDERRVMQVSFQTNVDSADRLRELAKKALTDLAENGPTADHFDKALKNLQKIIPESRLRNSYWATMINEGILHDIDYDKDYEAAVNALTPEQVRAAARELLQGNLVEIVMRPE